MRSSNVIVTHTILNLFLSMWVYKKVMLSIERKMINTERQVLRVGLSTDLILGLVCDNLENTGPSFYRLTLETGWWVAKKKHTLGVHPILLLSVSGEKTKQNKTLNKGFSSLIPWGALGWQECSLTDWGGCKQSRSLSPKLIFSC